MDATTHTYTCTHTHTLTNTHKHTHTRTHTHYTHYQLDNVRELHQFRCIHITPNRRRDVLSLSQGIPVAMYFALNPLLQFSISSQIEFLQHGDMFRVTSKKSRNRANRQELSHFLEKTDAQPCKVIGKGEDMEKAAKNITLHAWNYACELEIICRYGVVHVPQG